MKQELIDKNVEKALNALAMASHIARCASLIPQPKDFALMITGDIISMSTKVQNLVTRLNKLLDGYTNAPIEYFEDYINATVDSLNNTIGNVNSVADSFIDNAQNLANDVVGEVSKAVDMYSREENMQKYNILATFLSNEMNSLSTNNKEKLDKLNKELGLDKYEDIDKSELPEDVIELIEMRDSIMSMNDVYADGLDVSQETVKKIQDNYVDMMKKVNTKLNKVIDDISDIKNQAKDYVDEVTDKMSEKLESMSGVILKLLKELKESVDDFSKSVDKSFGVNTLKTSKMYQELSTVSKIDTSVDYNRGNLMDELVASMGATLISETSNTAMSILENFSIGKFVTACGGMLTSATMTTLCLDKLPEINVDKMLSSIAGTYDEKTGKYKTKNGEVFDDWVEYTGGAFNRFKSKFNDELNVKRNEIKKQLNTERNKENLKKKKKELPEGYEQMTPEERKTAIKEARKKKRQARKAKLVKDLKKNIKEKFKEFIREIKNLKNEIVYKWNAMMDNYKKAVNNVKQFFKKDTWKGGPGYKIMKVITDDINENYKKIVQLCTIDLPVQISNVTVNVTLPRAFGLCTSNFAQHIVQFLAECKVVIVFILNLLTCVFHIYSDIVKLANIISNGINNLKQILAQLLELLHFGFVKNLVARIVQLNNHSVLDAVEKCENYLQPVYFADTEKYSDMMEYVQKLINGENYDSSNRLVNENNVKQFQDNINNIALQCVGQRVFDNNYNFASQIYNGNYDDNKVVNDFMDKLEELGNTIVAYRSPIFNREELQQDVDESNYDEVIGPEVIGYHYFHPNVRHRDWREFYYKWTDEERLSYDANGNYVEVTDEMRMGVALPRREMYNYLIADAANKNNKKNGGLKMLQNTTKYYKNGTKSSSSTSSYISAFDAFYWYRVDTRDVVTVDYYPECDDCTVFRRANVSYTSDMGTVVTLNLGDGKTTKVFINDLLVKSGDYVNYNGNRYRIAD